MWGASPRLVAKDADEKLQNRQASPTSVYQPPNKDRKANHHQNSNVLLVKIEVNRFGIPYIIIYL